MATVNRWWASISVALLLAAALGLMWGPMHDETATNDEPVFLGAGYSYWQGQRYYLNSEHPPLMQLWSGLPLLCLGVQPPPEIDGWFDPDRPQPFALTWGYTSTPRADLFGPEVDRFYYYPAPEAGQYGRVLVYGGANDADRLLFWGRFMQALVMLATGGLVFVWAKSLSNAVGGLLALIAWTFNPLALAYGHLITTDAGIALLLPLAFWMVCRFLGSPGPRPALLAGVACGGAVLTKYTAIILVPMSVVTALAYAWRSEQPLPRRKLLAGLGLAALAAWATVMLCYFPAWSPPPPIAAAAAARLEVPGWFVALRPVLLPREFFKGFAILWLHVRSGHEGYLLGEWSKLGWWYYYPVAILVKTPLPLLLLMATAISGAVVGVRRLSNAQLVPLVGALVYLGCALVSKANIGIRHLLPMFPLLAVVVGSVYGRAGFKTRCLGWALAVWLSGSALAAHPFYLAYFNELAGGSARGQEVLLDSNFDWGQDGKRLKTWMQTNQVEHVYVDFFGIGSALRYHGIAHTRVTAEEARQLSDGVLVVSAMRLMRPEWAWLRERREPVDRIGYTLFVYRMR